jgi:hypothetical protein
MNKKLHGFQSLISLLRWKPAPSKWRSLCVEGTGFQLSNTKLSGYLKSLKQLLVEKNIIKIGEILDNGNRNL